MVRFLIDFAHNNVVEETAKLRWRGMSDETRYVSYVFKDQVGKEPRAHFVCAVPEHKKSKTPRSPDDTIQLVEPGAVYLTGSQFSCASPLVVADRLSCLK